MDKRTKMILERVDEKNHAKMTKEAALISKGAALINKRASLTETVGGVVGGGAALPVGAKVSNSLSKFLPKKYRALARILGITGSTFLGAKIGKGMGRDMDLASKNNEYTDMLNAARANREKALTDATAMRAFQQVGLEQPPPYK